MVEGRGGAESRRQRRARLDVFRLGGATLLHGRHHLHLRPVFRLAHGSTPRHSRSERRPSRVGLCGRSRRTCHRVLSPILGSIADQTGPRKPWIGFFATCQDCPASCCLWFAAPGSAILPILFAYTLASVAAEFSTVFNDSMLPAWSRKNDIGRVSNIAWGLGYLGGMIVLIFVLVTLAGTRRTGKTIVGIMPIFGLDPANWARTRASPGRFRPSGISCSSCRCSFSRPTPVRAASRSAPAVREGPFANLPSTLREVRQPARHPSLPGRAHDLPGRRRRAAGARRRLCRRHVSAGRSPRSASTASSSISSPSSVRCGGGSLDTAHRLQTGW